MILFEEYQAAGLDYSEGRKRIYDLYYVSDPVRLDKVGDEYDFVTGRYRIFSVRELISILSFSCVWNFSCGIYYARNY
jgi:hypothetical protein